MSNRNQQHFVGLPSSNVGWASDMGQNTLGQARNMTAQGHQGFFSANNVRPNASQFQQLNRASSGQVRNADGSYVDAGFRQQNFRPNLPAASWTKLGKPLIDQSFGGASFRNEQNPLWFGNVAKPVGPKQLSVTRAQWESVQPKPVVPTKANPSPVQPAPVLAGQISPGTLVKMNEVVAPTQQKGVENSTINKSGVIPTKPAGASVSPSKPPVPFTDTFTAVNPTKPAAGVTTLSTPAVPKGMSKYTNNPLFSKWWNSHPSLWKISGNDIRHAFDVYLKKAM